MAHILCRDAASALSPLANSFYMSFTAFPSLCSCCPAKSPMTTGSSTATSSPTCTSLAHSIVNAGTTPTSSASLGSSDPRSSSVAELRRKAQEHSAALLHSLQAAAAAGLAFPGFHLPPLSLHTALSSGRKPSDFISDLSMHHHLSSHGLSALGAPNLNNNNPTSMNNNSLSSLGDSPSPTRHNGDKSSSD
ncbi:AAEL008321-PA [Aedes aegypti]|uniref:AAEL008321-PA n=1 Tax=Aedes aegypti TaxID=7159 RepID=Q16Z44_AEDAE|nr:AAEL008321-PA [Aedes aegypti]